MIGYDKIVITVVSYLTLQPTEFAIRIPYYFTCFALPMIAFLGYSDKAKYFMSGLQSLRPNPRSSTYRLSCSTNTTKLTFKTQLAS